MTLYGQDLHVHVCCKLLWLLFNISFLWWDFPKIQSGMSEGIPSRQCATLYFFTEYGRQVKHTFVDSLFGGHLLSTVMCEECKHVSFL